jgi:D-alanyl-D-alanine carboxypeptidase
MWNQNMEKIMKNKIVKILILLILLVSCSSPQELDTDETEVKFTYQVKENIIFTEGELIDFSDILVGNYDSYEIGSINETIGQHVLTVTLLKDGETKTIGVPYTIKDKTPTSNYYLKSLEFEGYELDPTFTKENDVYTVTIPRNLVSFTVNAETDDPFASITSGTGVVQNPGYDFEHHITITAEDKTEFYYLVFVRIDESESIMNGDIETWNGYDINYPNSQLATIRSDHLTLVNKQYRLQESYVPSDLVYVDEEYQVYGGAHLTRPAYDAYIEMRNAASGEGLNLKVSTCYRDYDFQRTLYTNYLSQDTQEVVDTYSARPGHSEHQLGTSCDFASGVLNIDDFTGTPEDYWMRDNAADFGFILRFPEDKTDITGYTYESWHYRYIGINDAQEMKRLGVTLEEYLDQ